MLTLFAKKKITEDKVANAFVSRIIGVVENGWPDLAALIDTDPALVSCPNIRNTGPDKFLFIVIVANLKFLPKYFDGEQEDRMRFKIVERFSEVFEIDQERLYKHLKELQSFMSRINHPSNNVLYSMSKAVYHKYKLNGCQEDYFKNLNTPNPLLLKRLDDLMVNFIWDWENFLNKYKIAS